MLFSTHGVQISVSHFTPPSFLKLKLIRCVSACYCAETCLNAIRHIINRTHFKKLPTIHEHNLLCSKFAALYKWTNYIFRVDRTNMLMEMFKYSLLGVDDFNRLVQSSTPMLKLLYCVIHSPGKGTSFQQVLWKGTHPPGIVTEKMNKWNFCTLQNEHQSCKDSIKAHYYFKCA